MSRIILIRHGETDYNRQGRYRGNANLPLNRRGIVQAQAIKEHLRKVPISAIYASPLRRAKMTAQITAEAFDLSVNEIEALKDLDFGRWQGLSAEEAQTQFPELYALWHTRPDQVTFPEGENLGQVQHRAMETVIEITSRYPEGSVVLVTHEAVCQVIIAAVLGLELRRLWSIRQDLASISYIELAESRSVVAQTNETCHLQGIDD